MSDPARVAITGMAAITPLADELGPFLGALLEGRSAITQWKSFDASGIYSKVAADLADFDTLAAIAALEGVAPDGVFSRLTRLAARAPWSTRLSMLVAAKACRDAGLFEASVEPRKIAVVVAGHNLNARYIWNNHKDFLEEPDWIDGLMSLHGLDTDHAGSVSEVLQAKGPIYTVGGACASGNHALRCAVDEVRHHDIDVVVLVGAALDLSPVNAHAMAVMGAISHHSFNDEPAQASRPFDTRREGFVPAHGAAALIVERWDHARGRGAPMRAEVIGVEANADGNHLPQPSADGQAWLMSTLLERCGLRPEQIDYVNAHATSTPLGDITEARSLRRVFGAHAEKIKVNATKSMLGHCCWSAPVVEMVASVLQMQAGRLHPSINVHNQDPEIDLDVCADGPVDCEVDYLMKNAFGFGGINAVTILRRADAEEA